jgi:hypothetical protein
VYLTKSNIKMSSNQRKMLDTSIAPQKISQFRESLQGGYETCDAKVYADYIAQDVSLSKSS